MKFYLAKIQLLQSDIPSDYTPDPESAVPNARITVDGEHNESITLHMYIAGLRNRSLDDIENEVNQYINNLYSSC